MRWTRLRRLFQLLALFTFLWLTVAYMQEDSPWLTSGPLSRFDPLVGISAAIASRRFVAFWAASLLTVALTVALGRVWCGWICPVGTLLDLIPLARSKPPATSGRWRLGKYATLAVVLGAALLGNLGPMILDPVTIVTRPLQELARPLMGSDAVGQSIGGSIGRQAVHAVAFLSLLPLAAVLALNLLGSRFWCNNLCPLGGLLGLVSKLPGMRRRVSSETCTSCASCARACTSGTVSKLRTTDGETSFPSDPADCLVCMSCVDACKSGANRFAPASPLLGREYMPARRDALMAAGATGLGLTAAIIPVGRADAEILRPPSTSESRLAELCVRCGACYGACPSGVLRPSVSLTSEAGPWTPMLDERLPHCTLNCNRCAEPCPTDALHTPTLEEAWAWGLGAKAEVDRNWCRAWARNRACMACQTKCPIAGALGGQKRPEHLPNPRRRPPATVPVIDPELCVGCNECASACVMNPPAIGVPRRRKTGSSYTL